MTRCSPPRLVATLAAFALLAACGGDDDGTGPDMTDTTAQADSLLAAAIASMENAMYTALNIDGFALDSLDSFSFAESNALFQEALDAAPSNDTAALGFAMTTIFALEDDSGLRAAAEEWDAWIEEGPDPVGPMGTLFAAPAPLRWGRTTLPVDLSGADVSRLSRVGLVAAELAASPGPLAAPPPSISSHQTLLSDVVAPALEDALAAVQEITNSAFTFDVTERMQGEDPGEADVLELDYTEVLALQAGIELALASIDVVTAYSLQPNPLSISGFVTAMTPGSNFLTLNTGGAAALAEALTRIESAADLVLDGLDALEAETDDQSDDIIKHDPSGLGDGLSDDDITEARNVITDIQTALSGPTTVTIDEGGPDELSFQLDVSEFFLDPIDDLKAMLPPYEVGTATEETEDVILFRWTELNLADWTFTDPTFSGILPGMSTTQDLIDTFEVDELFFEFSLASGYYRLITVDGTDCLDDYVNGSGMGCPIGGVYYYDGSVDLGGYDGMSEAFAVLYGTSSFFSAAGPYAVTDAGDGDPATFTVTMNMEDGSMSPVTWVGDLTDQPGYTSTDAHFRHIGGSVIVVDYLDSTLVFEKD